MKFQIGVSLEPLLAPLVGALNPVDNVVNLVMCHPPTLVDPTA
jgi:hypothetical protein